MGKNKDKGTTTGEVSSGGRPIEAVGTATAAFVGTDGEAPAAPRRAHRLRRVVVLAVLVAAAALAVRAWRRAQP